MKGFCDDAMEDDVFFCVWVLLIVNMMSWDMFTQAYGVISGSGLELLGVCFVEAVQDGEAEYCGCYSAVV
jgi:hypothetical protein